MEDISIQGKVVKVIEYGQMSPIIVNISNDGGQQIILNFEQEFRSFIEFVTTRGTSYETLSFMWDDVGGKWVVFR